MPTQWEYILWHPDAIEGEGFVDFATSLEAIQDSIDQFINDGVSKEYIEALVISEIKSERSVRVERKGIISTPKSPKTS